MSSPMHGGAAFRLAPRGTSIGLGVAASVVALGLGAALFGPVSEGRALALAGVAVDRVALPVDVRVAAPASTPPSAWLDRMSLRDLDPYRGVAPPTADATYGSTPAG